MDSHNNSNLKNIDELVYDNEKSDNHNDNIVDVTKTITTDYTPPSSIITANDIPTRMDMDPQMINSQPMILSTSNNDIQYNQTFNNSTLNYNYLMDSTNLTNPFSINGSYLYTDDNYYTNSEPYFNGTYNGYVHHGNNLMHNLSNNHHPTHTSYIHQTSNVAAITHNNLNSNINGNIPYYNGTSMYTNNTLNNRTNNIHRHNYHHYHQQQQQQQQQHQHQIIQHNTSNPYFNGLESNSYINNYSYEQFINQPPQPQSQHQQQQQLQGSRVLPSHITSMAPINRTVTNSPHYNLNRYHQTTNSNSNNNSTSCGNNNNHVITSEMLSVANTTTMTAFASESVCRQINSILSGTAKDHQAIVLATKGSLNKTLNDRNGHINDNELSWIDKNMSRKVDVEETVDEILKATGFDNGSNDRNRNYYTYNSFSYNKMKNNGVHPSHVIKSKSNQSLVNDCGNLPPIVTHHRTNIESQSARISCDNNPNTITNGQSYHVSTKLHTENLPNDTLTNRDNQHHTTVKSSAIDLSISSDEDIKNMEYGPVGSNPRKFHYYQQNNFCVSPSNFNTPTVVRRKSQNINGVRQSNKPSNTINIKSIMDQHQHTTRTRSLGDNQEIDNTSNIVDDTIDVFSELTLNTNYSNIHSFTGSNAVNNPIDYTYQITNQSHVNNSLCIHNELKEFCLTCCTNVPSVPHESVITRMSSTISNPIPPQPFILHQSPRNSSCEYPQSSVSPIRQRNLYNTIKNVGHNNGASSKSEVTHKKDIYSRKVFVGGLPQDITETQIAAEFKRFGDLIVDWPHKLDSNSGLPPKGYAFLLFDQAESVISLINNCSRIDDKYFWTVSSQRSESKQVQIRPWTLTDSIWSINSSIEKPVPRCKRTVFVGGIPRQAQARELFDNMNHCFGGVDLVEIDVDIEYSYPKGAASVTFINDECYIKALEAHFITLKLCGMEKRVEIKPFFSDDQHCEECGIHMNSRSGSSNNTNNNNNNSSGSPNQPIGQCFCIARECLKYFCENCWIQHQIHAGHGQSQHSNKSGSYHRQFQFRRTNVHNTNNNGNNNCHYLNRSSTN